MTQVPDYFALYALGAGILAALLVAGAGIVAVAGRARKLRERVEGYSELPIFRHIELAVARIAIGSAAVERAGVLTERARHALADIAAAKDTVAAAAGTAAAVLKRLVRGR